jgi:arsenite methyltransferase
MPLIQVKLIENVFSRDQKREMIERLTDAMVEIEGENMRSVTWVTVEEVASGDWGIAGNAVTTEDVKTLHRSTLSQTDATMLVDRADLERRVKEMYRGVARYPQSQRHFDTGRNLALRLGYPKRLLDAIPQRALESYAGVGYHLDVAQLGHGDRVLDLGSGSGTDAFCAAVLVGQTGRVVGVDFTDEQLAKATSAGERRRVENVQFVDASVDRLPFDDASFDVVMTNGVVNLSPVKHRVFIEAARVLRPGGRLVVSDIVSTTPLKESTRRDTELWAACVAGAIPGMAYLDALATSGFTITTTRRNHYWFVSDRADRACRTYGITSTTIAAIRGPFLY